MIFITGGAGQGKLAYAKEMFGEELYIVDRYHEQVAIQLKDGQNPIEEVKKFLKEEKPDVVISDELGCGLVPIDKDQRKLREQSGRVSCYLAQQADSVIRVICGVGVKIK